MTTKQQLEKEIKMLILKKNMHFLESKTSFYLFTRNRAKAAYNFCIQELSIKKQNLKAYE